MLQLLWRVELPLLRSASRVATVVIVGGSPASTSRFSSHISYCCLASGCLRVLCFVPQVGVVSSTFCSLSPSRRFWACSMVTVECTNCSLFLLVRAPHVVRHFFAAVLLLTRSFPVLPSKHDGLPSG